jgi:hypothetical protein
MFVKYGLVKSRIRIATMLFGLCPLAIACQGSVDAQPASLPITDVTFCRLAKNPLEYAGKQIRIRGILRYALEMVLLEQPECCPEKKLEYLEVPISGNPTYPDRNSERLIRKLTRRPAGVALVVLVGSLNGRLLKVERVERIEKLARPIDKARDPSWVPRNCIRISTTSSP